MSCKRFATSRARIWRKPPGTNRREATRGGPQRGVVWVGALVLATLLSAPSSSSARTLNAVTKIAVSEQGNNTVVRLLCDRKPMFSVFKLERPPRLTIDLANTQLARVASLVDVDSWAVSQIGTTQFRTSAATIARVMINFRRRAHYTVRNDGQALVVTVMPHKARPIPAGDKRSAAEIARARNEAKDARRAASVAQKAATQARADLGRLAREAEEAKLEARRARQLADSAKSKVAKLSKAAHRANEMERRARVLAQQAEQARLEALRTKAQIAASEQRVKRLEQDARRARGVEADAKRLAREAEVARNAAARARKDAEAAQALIAKLRGEASRARDEAKSQRLKADKQARALKLAQAAMQRHTRELDKARAASKRLQATLDRVQGEATARRAKVAELTKQVVAARRTASSDRANRRAARQLAAVEGALSKARAAARKAELDRQRVARQLASAELRSKTADEGRRQAEQARQQAQSARLSAEQGRKLAERRVQEETKRRVVAEHARQQAIKRAAVLAQAIARVRHGRARVDQAVRRVEQLQAALKQAKQRELAHRGRVERADRELRVARSRARKADQERRSLAAEMAVAQRARRQQASELVRLRTTVQQQKARASRALAVVAQLRQARDAARQRVASKRGAAAQQARQTLATVEKKLASAEEAGRRARREHGRSLDAVRAASARQKQLAARLVTTKNRLADVSSRLKRIEGKVGRAGRELNVSRRQLQAVAQRRQQEEHARGRAMVARKQEEGRLKSAKLARRQAERARSDARRELKKLQAALGKVRRARRAEEARLAHLRRPGSGRMLASGGGKLPQGATASRWNKPTVSTQASVRNISFADKAGHVEVQIRLHGKARHRVYQQDDQLVLALDGAQLPKLLQRTLDTSAFKGPVRSISSFVTGSDRVYVKVDAAGSPKHRLRRRGDLLVWEFDKPAAQFAAGAKQTPAKDDRAAARTYSYKTVRVAGARTRARRSARYRRRRYFGRRIDLDFKDADIHNILRLLSQVGNVNIITSDDVRGKVTIRMRNVPWDQAMDVILRAKGMGQVREGNLVRVAPMADLEKEREAEIARRKQMAQLQPLETRLIPLSYADAQKVLPKLQYTTSPRGKLTFDERTNMVIARDVAANLNLLEKMIRNLDTQTPQVMIEARIIEARSNYTKEIGIQWGGSFAASSATGNSTGLAFPNQIGIGGGATDGNTPTAGILFGQAANPNFAVNMPAGVGSGAGGALGLTLGSVSGAFNINLRLSAAETKGDIRIVSAPRITTMDNVEASIEQGVQIPFSQVSAAGTQTIFKDAKLNLTVKPHVTADGSVIMKVSVERNEPDFVNTGARGQPTILKKQAKTEMLIKDGDTAVIGGIYTTRDGRAWQKVPWFADIPIIGWFFKSRRDTSDREEVLVFITPRIINRAQSIGR